MAFSEGSWIQGLLLAAKEDLAYCKFILDFEKKSGKNYNASINIDQFYKRVSVLSFNDALLIVASLLDGSEVNARLILLTGTEAKTTLK